jgi:pimeloyl-ACP methyl ester carboxylesterase
MPEYRDVVRAFLRAAGAERAVLVGHSMGGGITQAVALAEPALLRGIVLVGTGARLRVHPNIFEVLRRDHAEAARLVAGWGFGPAAPAAMREEGVRDFLSCPAAVSEADFHACDGFDVMAEIARIRVPALIVCGEQDILTPTKYARYLYGQIRGSRLVLVPEAGHYVMREQPAAVNRALEGFLADL